MNAVMIIIATIMFLHLGTRLIAAKGTIIKKPCTLHKWYYGEDGDMICSNCNKKPGDVMK